MDNREDVKRFLEKSLDTQKETQEYAKNYANQLQSQLPSLTVRADNNQVTITMPYLQAYARRQGIKFIDMKQYFARSSKVKRKKNGGWYLIVPIGNKASELKSASPRKMWETVSHSPFGSTSQLSDEINNYLEQGFSSQSNQNNQTVPELNYSWKSSNVTRIQKGPSGKYGSYISFRTVSDKSDPRSWLVGRQAFSEDSPNIDMIRSSIVNTLTEAMKHV